jgi:hypothetical protein
MDCRVKPGNDDFYESSERRGVEQKPARGNILIHRQKFEAL